MKTSLNINVTLTKALLCFVIIFLLACADGSVPCKKPSPEMMERFMTDSTGNNSKDSVVLIRELCEGMKNCSTSTWVRGVRVKDNCGNIQPFTAIATFAGKNNTYNRVGYQHAAIFISCNKQNIQVYDQAQHSKGVRQRRLRYGGPPSTSNGNAYYTIE